tara:strand:+ start:17 stop:463 length:447 start_codon:yes stop_codon:yes gene_type:complete
MIEYQDILNKNLLKVFIDVLKNIEANGLDGKNHLYITFKADNSKNIIPDWLLTKYPDEMTIVIQHEYYHLSVYKNFFNIGLSFNNKKTNLKISFDSIISFADPSSNFGLNFQFNNSNKKVKKKKKKVVKKKNKDYNSNVIEFSSFKKN